MNTAQDREMWIDQMVITTHAYFCELKLLPENFREHAEEMFARFCAYDTINAMEFEGDELSPWPKPAALVSKILGAPEITAEIAELEKT